MQSKSGLGRLAPELLSAASFDAPAIVSNQFILTPAGWKISALAWGDERPGLAIAA
jgi:hypothetical protein